MLDTARAARRGFGPNRSAVISPRPSLRLAVLLLCAAFAPTVSAFAQRAEAEEYAQRGFELASTGTLKAAETEFRRALTLDSQSARYLADLGGVLGREGNLAGAGGASC